MGKKNWEQSGKNISPIPLKMYRKSKKNSIYVSKNCVKNMPLKLKCFKKTHYFILKKTCFIKIFSKY